MDELIRRALLGNRQAQEECTRRGIVLPCPFCGGKSEFVHLDLEAPFSDRRDVFEVQCRKCGCAPFSLSDYNLFYTEEGMEKAKQLKRKAIADCNTRPAPPIGRCGECEWYVPRFEWEGGYIPSNCTHPLTELYVINDEDYCSYFEPKETHDEGN